MATVKQVERQNRIFKAAMGEFCRQGFHKANVDEIADRAKVGKGTIYRHYNHKEGLFLAVFDHTLANLEKTIKAKADFSSFEKGSRVAIRTYLEEISNNPEVFNFFRLFTSDHLLNDSDLRQKLVDRYFSSALWASEENKRAQSNGQIRKNIDPVKLSYATLGMIHFIAYQWNRAGRSQNLVENTGWLCDLFFNGILTKNKGVETKGPEKKAPAKKSVISPAAPKSKPKAQTKPKAKAQVKSLPKAKAKVKTQVKPQPKAKAKGKAMAKVVKVVKVVKGKGKKK